MKVTIEDFSIDENSETTFHRRDAESAEKWK